MKRQRGRGRKPGGGHHNHHQPNRTMESSGPDIKVRGPAAHIFERYLQLARDAASSGDRVLSENYLQHADHYFRLVRSMQPAMPPPSAEREAEFDADDAGGGEAEGAHDAETMAESGDQPDVDFPQGQQPQQFDRGEGEFRRRRGRRNRFRPDGDRDGAEARDGGERRPREGEGGEREPAGPEGFSSGPKPAFLRGGD